jgi:glycosyltransferase involved in cell wall biosynthesis
MRLKNFHRRMAKTDHAADIIPHIGGRPATTSRTADRHFRLVHAGKLLAADGRFGKTILLGLKSFLATSAAARAETKLVLVGPGDPEMTSMISEMGLEHNVEFIGRVSYEESLRHVESASVCVLIEARMPEGIFFASKLSDYLAQGKPVLAISPAIGTAEDLAKLGELMRVDQEPEAVRNAIALLYAEYKDGRISSRGPSKELQAEMQQTAIGAKFVKICETLIAGRTGSRKSRSKSVTHGSAVFDQFS